MPQHVTDRQGLEPYEAQENLFRRHSTDLKEKDGQHPQAKIINTSHSAIEQHGFPSPATGKQNSHCKDKNQ